MLLTKVARWDPDKRWIMALADLKAQGMRPLLVARAGQEPHGEEVVARAESLGLSSSSVGCVDASQGGLRAAIAPSSASDIVLIRSPLARSQLQLLYRASDVVLANSGFEPFGLGGLERWPAVD